MLEETNPLKRLEYVISNLKNETELLKLEHEIEHKVHESMDENQRDYYLREQMKVISEEPVSYTHLFTGIFTDRDVIEPLSARKTA